MDVMDVDQDPGLIDQLLQEFENRETQAQVTLTSPSGTVYHFTVRGVTSYEEMMKLREEAATYAEHKRSTMDFAIAAKLYVLHKAVVSPKITIDKFILLSQKIPMFVAGLEIAINKLTELDLDYNEAGAVEEIKNS